VTNTHSRRTFLHTSITTGATFVGVPDLFRVYASSRDFLRPPLKPTFPVTDFHIHLSEQLSIDQAVNLGKERGVNVGIVEHPGPDTRSTPMTTSNATSTPSARIPSASACSLYIPDGRKLFRNPCSATLTTF